MHASGFIKGLQANGADVSTCVSYREINHPLISNMQPILRPAMYKKMYLSKPRVVVRYAFSKTLEIFLLSLYAKLIGVQLWVEVNSLRKNMIQNRYLKVAIFHLEVLFFSLSYGVIAVSPRLKTQIQSKYSGQVLFLPNGHNLSFHQQAIKINEQSVPTVLYLGTDQPYYSFAEIVELNLNKKVNFKYYGRIKNPASLESSLYDCLQGSYKSSDLHEIL